MTDHITKLSVTVVIPSKKPNHIANAILKYWAALVWYSRKVSNRYRW